VVPDPRAAGVRERDAMKLDGAVAVVTGGAQGIGAEIVRAFAREGAVVAVADRRPATAVIETVEAIGGRCIGMQVDVTDEQAVRGAFAAVEDELGPVDVLVNNAAIGTPVQLVRDLELKAWERTLAINLTGTMLCTREALRSMSGRGGAIVNIASNVAKRGLPYRAAYVSSKWAVLGFTQTVALEAAQDGIRVNAICPGPVETPHLDEVVRGHAEAEGRTESAVLEDWRTSSPMGRLIELREVADVAVFLASDASSAMTGQAINVTGGLIMH
jgi:NAD(P)-dependent dehydrogenase (short-subunit alcohol dehydrogenase family)